MIAFRGATLIDGTGAPPIPNSLLVVEGDRIVAVGAATPETTAKLPPGTQVVAADGKWIVPGLIDAHVHAESDADLRTMLHWGITSVRLMAEDTVDATALAKETNSTGEATSNASRQLVSTSSWATALNPPREIPDSPSGSLRAGTTFSPP